MKKGAPKRQPRQPTKASKLDATIRAVQGWQAYGRVHPLTCGNDSSHAPLVAEKRGQRVVLICPSCDYVQAHIPAIVLQAGAKMTPGKPRGPLPAVDLEVPPSPYDFEETVRRVLRVKPPAKSKSTAARKAKSEPD